MRLLSASLSHLFHVVFIWPWLAALDVQQLNRHRLQHTI